MLNPLLIFFLALSEGWYPAGGGKRSACMRLLSLVLLIVLRAPVAAQEQAVWEYAPYRVQIWHAFEPHLSVTEQARQRFLGQLEHELRRVFKATWRYHIQPMPERLKPIVFRNQGRLSFDDLSRNEWTLVVASGRPETRSIRTFQAAAESLSEVRVSPSTQAAFENIQAQIPLEPDSSESRIMSKLKVQPDGDQAIIQSLVEQKISAALVPRAYLKSDAKIRTISTLLPWQTDVMLDHRDKLFLIVVGAKEDQFHARVMELDCTTRVTGPMVTGQTDHWSQVTQLTSRLMQQAFAPMARIEEADDKVARLRHRAGGLISPDDQGNPSRIGVGDLMQPIVRRDDQNGQPLLLKALKFTFAAITQSDGVTMTANVYTYSGGPGLKGRQNPRTRRLLLRVRPVTDQSQLQIVAREQPQRALAGCAIYTKDWLTDQFQFLGRTDWSGQLPVTAPPSPVSIMPSSVKTERAALLQSAREAAIAQARAEYQQKVQQAETQQKVLPPLDVSNVVVPEMPVDPATLVHLTVPLIQIYVKSGDRVSARLPFVPGLADTEIAELNDESLQLHAESLVRGFQGEILDLVGQRNLLSARVRLHISQGQLDQATKRMEQMRNLKDFNQMNDQLSLVQRNVLERLDAGGIRSSQTQIDRMFKNTRDLLQKFLQDQIVAETEDALRQAVAASMVIGSPEK